MLTPYTLCAEVLRQITAALTAAGSEAVIVAYPGVGLPPWDNVCGQLVVAPEVVFRSVEFPVEYNGPEYCFDGNIAVQLLVSLVRCVPTLDNAGRAPSAESIAAAHERILADAATVWNTLLLDDLIDAILPGWEGEWEHALPSQQFVEARGGGTSIDTRITIGLPYELWCP